MTSTTTSTTTTTEFCVGAGEVCLEAGSSQQQQCCPENECLPVGTTGYCVNRP